MNFEAEWMACAERGDFAGAWKINSLVLAQQDPTRRDDPTLPYHLRWVWDGQPFDGKHVLVRCYHGLGDTLQFARFLPLLGRRAASVRVETQPSLVPLFQSFQEVDEVFAFDVAAPAPPSECDLEIMELGFALRALPEDAPPPYLTISPAALPPDTIGLCWRAGDWDPDRSIDEPALQPLTAARCLTLLPQPTALDVLNPNGAPLDMQATAALVQAVDLVITVDTMVAHLAGALGRPTWLLLKHDADWRWMKDRRDSPWYPTMRIYRQPVAGDWASVLAEVEADLAAFCTTDQASYAASRKGAL